MVSIVNPASFQSAMRNGVNLMLGAGFSVLAKDGAGKPPPTGSGLADELRTAYRVDTQRNLNLAQICSIIAAKDREGLTEYLKSRFSVAHFDARYQALWRARIKNIFTTNIDDLLQRVYSNCTDYYLNDLALHGPVFRDRASINLICLHGSVTDDSRPYRFTAPDVAGSFNADPTYWHAFRQRLLDAPTVFWGYSVEDAAALEALQMDHFPDSTRGENWIVLRPRDGEHPLAEYFRALNFQLVFAETAELLDYLGEIPKPAETTRGTLSEKLCQYRVPSPGSVPQRPVQDFYSGAAPSWSDIFRLDLHRLKQYRDALEVLQQDRNVVLTGIPASGKTTLLMQLAATGVGGRIAIMPSGLSVESAQRIVQVLAGAPATVYLDNFCDDIGAYTLLTQQPNIQVVAADRDYNVSTVIHRINEPKRPVEDPVEFVSLSQIDQNDLGAIRARIPTAIRTQRMEHAIVTAGMPSLLEFNLANTTTLGLRDRIETALYELQQERPLLGEMLLFVAYVHSCRTPVSLDMAIAYWREKVSNWQDIYAMNREVGQLLSEYEGDLKEDDGQDYFATRSVIVADAALKSSGSAALRRMLYRFHQNISTVRICRYDVFRRRAYTSELFGRAFPDADEAAKFYDFLFDRDPNPYLLQQKARLLSSRSRFDESFVDIDRALGMTNGKNWTIRATHAELLFRANLRFAVSDSDARRQVDRAMAILETCYRSDRRRSLHALQFGGRAIEYYKLFGDAQARDYLTRALEWLRMALAREPWLTRVGPLMREIERLLA